MVRKSKKKASRNRWSKVMYMTSSNLSTLMSYGAKLLD